MAKRYRYISNGSARPSDQICKFRLIGGNQLKSLDCRFADVIRVAIPDDMVLEKWSCDSYSTTDDSRTFEELNYDIVVRINEGMVVRNDLKPEKSTDRILDGISSALEAEGYRLTNEGYLDKQRYAAYRKAIRDAAEARYKQAEELKVQLDNHKCSVSDLTNIEKDVILEVLEMYIDEARK